MKFPAAAILTFLPLAVPQMKKDYCLDQTCSQTILPTPPECQKQTFAEWSACICTHPKWAGLIALCLEECDPADRGFVRFCPGGSVPRPSSTTGTTTTVVVLLPPSTSAAAVRSSSAPSAASTLLPLEPTGAAPSVFDSGIAATATASVETQHPLAVVPGSLVFSTSGLFVPLATQTVGASTLVDTVSTSTPTASSAPISAASASASASASALASGGGRVGVGLGLFGTAIALAVCFAFLAGV